MGTFFVLLPRTCGRHCVYSAACVYEMNLRPLLNKLFVKQDNAETVSRGGIIIPDTAKKAARRGRVLAIGSDCKDVKVDDIVYWTNYGGEEVKQYDGVWLLRETDVMCIE